MNRAKQNRIQKDTYNMFLYLFRLYRAKQGRTQKEFLKLCKEWRVSDDMLELFEAFARAKKDESKSFAELKKKTRIEYLTGV